MMKRLTLSLLLAGLTTAAYAGQVGNPVAVPAGVNLIAADSTGFWTLGIEGFLVQSTSPQFQYAQIVDTTTPTLTDNDNYVVGQGYHAGFEVDATYHFQGNNRDVTLAFTHVEMNDGGSTQLQNPATQAFSDNFGLIPSPARNVDITRIRGETNQDYNAIDLVFGQHIQVGDRLDIHPFAGLRFADLNTRSNLTEFNTSPTAFQTKQATAQIESEYEGLGPRFGLGATLHATTNISFIGQVGASLLVGNDNENILLQENSYQQTLLITVPVSVTNYSNGNNIYVVPELDARLGIDVEKRFSSTTSVNVQAGYMVTNYFHAIEADFNDINLINSVNNADNFGFQGPYVRLQISLV